MPSTQEQSMAEAKTKATDASVDDHITARAANVQQHADCMTLMSLLTKVTGEKPRMWGPSIVGYGSYQYRYDSGQSGAACMTGFAIRGKEIVVYLTAESKDQAELLGKLGKHKMGKSCLYFKSLADIDLVVLEYLISGSIAELLRRNPRSA